MSKAKGGEENARSQTTSQEGKKKRKRPEKDEKKDEAEGGEPAFSPSKRRRRIEDEKPSFEVGKGKLDEEIIRLWQTRFDNSQASLSQSAASEGLPENLLGERVQSVEVKELTSYVTKCANAGGDATPVFMRAIFQGLPASGDTMEQGKTLRVAVLELLIWLMIYGSLEDRRAKECVTAMLGEMDFIDDEDYVGLVELIIRGLSQARTSDVAFLDFLPKMLAGIERVQEVQTDSTTVMTGIKYKSHILTRICDLDWSTSIVIPLITVFREIPMNADDLRSVFSKPFQMLSQIDLQELPSLFYQLLLLSTKGQTEHKSKLLREIAKHLEALSRLIQQKEEEDKDGTDWQREQIALRHVEGTTLIHLTFAIKQDQELGKAFLRVFNKENFPLTSFTVALLLSMARIQRFEDLALEAIKTAVINYYRESVKKDASYWYLSMKQRLPTPLPVELAIMETVKHSAYGWEHITQSLVHLGVLLIESAPAPSSSPSGSVPASTMSTTATATAPPTAVNSASAPTSYGQLVINLGINVLLETFRIHDMVRSAILEQIFSHVVTSKAWHVIHFVNLLAKLVKECKPLLLELGKGGENYISKIKENFDYLSELSPSISHALLEAVQPIMAINQAFQDHIILVLRKSMFSREVESRVTGVQGFLHLLSGCASHVAVTPQQVEGARNLCFEILGFLRRCLSQQWEIRECLYAGLIDVFKSSQYPEVKEAIFDMLLHQFLHYYEVDVNKGPPLYFEKCVEVSNVAVAVKKMEPFPTLLNTIQECVFQYSRDSIENDAMSDVGEEFKSNTTLKGYLDDLVERLSTTELEEFELDKTSDYKTTTTKGLYHNEAASLLKDTYESAIDWVVLKAEPTTETLQLVFKLYKVLVRLRNEAKEAANGGIAEPAAAAAGDKKKDKEGTKGKRGRKAKGTATVQEKKQKKTYLSLNCILGLIQIMTEKLDSDDNESESREALHERAKARHMLRENHAFCLFFLNACTKWLKQINAANDADSEVGRRSSSIQTVQIKFCEKLSPFLLNEFIFSMDFSHQGQDKQIHITVLECLELALRVVVKHKTPRRMAAYLESFVPSIEEEEEEEEATNAIKRDRADPEYLIHRNILKLKMLLVKMIQDKKYREADLLRQIIEMLLDYILVPKCVDGILPQHVKWLENICTGVQLENVPLAKALIALYFKVSRFLPNTDIVSGFVADINAFLPFHSSQEEEAASPKPRRYSIINQSTVGSVIVAIVNLLDGYYDEIEHLITVVSAMEETDELYSDSDDDEEEEAALARTKDRLQRSIYIRMGELVNQVHDLCRCQLPVACYEHVFKFLTKIYKVFSQATAQILASKKTPSADFRELIEFSGTELSSSVYETVLAANNSKEATVQRAKGKVKKEINTIPNLIFAIERYEGSLIKLGKMCKTDLLKNFRRSTARDFRIQADVVEQRKNEIAHSEELKKQKKEKPSQQGSGQKKKGKGKAAQDKGKEKVATKKKANNNKK